MLISELIMKHSKTYVSVTILGIILAISLFIVLSWLSTLTVTGMNHIPINEVDMHVFVNNNNPLTLTIYLKTLNDHHHIEFLRAEIRDNNNNTVAEYQGRLVGGIYEWKKITPICELPPESEKTVRLNYNTTISQGKYSLVLYSQHFGLYPLLRSDFIAYKNYNKIYY